MSWVHVSIFAQVDYNFVPFREDDGSASSIPCAGEQRSGNTFDSGGRYTLVCKMFLPVLIFDVSLFGGVALCVYCYEEEKAAPTT